MRSTISDKVTWRPARADSSACRAFSAAFAGPVNWTVWNFVFRGVVMFRVCHRMR